MISFFFLGTTESPSHHSVTAFLWLQRFISHRHRQYFM